VGLTSLVVEGMATEIIDVPCTCRHHVIG